MAIDGAGRLYSRGLGRAALAVCSLAALVTGPAQSVAAKRTGCSGSCPQQRLESEDVERVIRSAVAEASTLGVVRAAVAVVDRVGNVLAVYQLPSGGTGGAFTDLSTTITSQRPSLTEPSGLEGLVVPASLAAISKAGTAAYLSSQGNAFTTRTASQIIQENFNPRERNRAGGPLFGVQFSQLPCGDLVRSFPDDARLGPKRMPLGFAGDPGGLPLYKAGVPVGGVGVEFDGTYTIDLDVAKRDSDPEERVASAATRGFEAPADRRADRIAVDGRYLRFADDQRAKSKERDLLPFDPAGLVAVPLFCDASVQPGALFLDPASGVAPGADAALGAHEILVDAAGANRFPPRGSVAPAPGDGGLVEQEVAILLREALRVAARSRAQIRRPTGSAARVNVSVSDLDGTVLGFARSPDAPVFGIDVSLQKARTASFLSSANAGADLVNAGLGAYVDGARAFLDDPTALTGTLALADRSIGNLARPFFPDGINGRENGPLSLPFRAWSPFSTGLQLDAAFDQLALSVCPLVPSVQCLFASALGAPIGSCPPAPPDPSNPCVCSLLPTPAGTCTDPVALAETANGLQIFPGSFPIYRGGALIGAIGVSGDGVDQDDLVAFLGLDAASRAPDLPDPAHPFGNAPPAIRADTVALRGGRLRYVSCPPSPFNNSREQRPCSGR